MSVVNAHTKYMALLDVGLICTGFVAALDRLAIAADMLSQHVLAVLPVFVAQAASWQQFVRGCVTCRRHQ